ncbi:MAG TPA: MBL fold metallo-hydrolase [Planctomycetes bacterium]|nr:MBL fold metallo-hydrolase [Planctomycetota bacterium]
MHLQVLSSGSAGNSILLRHDEMNVLVDAGLPLRGLFERFEAARLAPQRVDHVVITHGHLDHARSAGAFSRRTRARVHCALGLMRNRSIAGAHQTSVLPVNGTTELSTERNTSPIRVRTAALSHDADPTVGLRFEADGRTAVILTDMGRPDPGVHASLSGAHLLVLEFNHDAHLLARGPYPPRLRARISGGRGHLSNEHAATVLRELAGPELHTLVLAHLSRRNNRPDLALASAHAALAAIGREDVRVLVADQDEVGPNLSV